MNSPAGLDWIGRFFVFEWKRGRMLLAPTIFQPPP